MIITLPTDFIDELSNRYTYKGHTQILDANHYYTASILINDTPFVAYIPLHSYCRANFIPILPPNESPHWRSHGLEYGKTILLTSDDLTNHASVSGVDEIVWNDILFKQELIVKEVKAYFIEIINSMTKKESGLWLSRFEKRNLNYSTLNCFPEHIATLRKYDISQLEFKFVCCSTIDSLVTLITY